MSINVRGYAALSPKGALGLFHFIRRELRPDDLLIEILYCGICHSDLHNVNNESGYSKYPMVPGHEIVGRVTRIGQNVKKFAIGDQVGIGCLVDSCRTCPSCLRGHEQSCLNFVTYAYGSKDKQDGLVTQGGYSESIVVREDFALKIPKSLDLIGAAPLLCAGITTWAPLRRENISKGCKVAIVGLGGLGHIAIKLAKSLGAEVTLITRSLDKADEAKALGADFVIASGDNNQMSANKAKFQLILDTVPYSHDLNPLVSSLTANGKLVLLGYFGPIEPSLNTNQLIFGQRSIEGSLIGGIRETQEMLDFCGEHQITAETELIKIQDVNKAYRRMFKSDVKYRFVIDLKTIESE